MSQDAPPAFFHDAQVAVVIPAYRNAERIEAVVRGVPAFVRHVIVVDDASPDGTADRIAHLEGDRVRLIRHLRNQGVGGATLTGYALALELGADIVVKLDADDQMDPTHLPRLLTPIARAEADYTKGNRFMPSVPARDMPAARLVGNLGLTFLTKLASGYWNVFDPTNGYTAIDARLLRYVDSARVERDYFFETSMLLELRRLRAVVRDVPIPARYRGERSSMSLLNVLSSFPLRLLAGLLRRLGRQYFLHDFSPVALLLLFGLPLLSFGVSWGAVHWYLASASSTFASTGTVLVAVLPIILGVQFLVQALSLDIGSVPRRPVGPDLASEGLPQDVGLVGYLERHAAEREPAAR